MPGQFVDSIINENLKVATEYFKATVSNIEKNPDSGGTIGFIPFKINFTVDGISGIKIYNELNVNTDFLPNGYTKTTKFIVTGVDHKLSNGDWETVINTTLIPNASNIGIITREIVLAKRKSEVKEIILAPTTPTDVNLAEKYESDNSIAIPLDSPDCTPAQQVIDQSTAVANPMKIKNEGNKAGMKFNNITSKNQKYIYGEYLDALLTLPKYSTYTKGLKLLITAMAIQEGYYPGTRAYTKKNPGNIGNTDSGANRNMGSLGNGILNQIEYCTMAAYNIKPNRFTTSYYFGPQSRKNSYSPESKRCDPGFKIDFQGQLGYFLYLYATGPRTSNSYLQHVMGFFKLNGIEVNGQTKLSAIINMPNCTTCDWP